MNTNYLLINKLDSQLIQNLDENERIIRREIDCFDQTINLDEQLDSIIKNIMSSGVNDLVLGSTNCSTISKLKYLILLQERRLKLKLAFLLNFRDLFRHPNGNMSLKYIGRKLGLTQDALIIWFGFESVPITKKRHGLYVSFWDFWYFMRRISRNTYEFRK